MRLSAIAARAINESAQRGIRRDLRRIVLEHERRRWYVPNGRLWKRPIYR